MPLRVLHLPTNVGNHPQGLARAERSLGLHSVCVALERPSFAYEVDELAWSERRATVERRRWLLLKRALREADVVHFNFGRSLMPPPPARRGGLAQLPGRLYARLLATRDLPLLARAGKAIVVTFQGDDARQAHGPHARALHRRLGAEAGHGYYTAEGDARKRRVIEAFGRHADRIFFLNPDLGGFLPARARFVPYASVDPAEWTPRPPAPLREVPVVVHAPSHRGVKGTDHVLAAVEALRREGVAFEFRLIEDQAHADARRVYEEADVLVDQVLVGWYGGLAVELMALGRPVVCAIDEPTARRHVPAGLLDDLPLVRAAPGELAGMLRSLLTDRRGDYPELARRSRAFVERWHDPRTIAAALRTEYEAALAERQARRS